MEFITDVILAFIAFESAIFSSVKNKGKRNKGYNNNAV